VFGLGVVIAPAFSLDRLLEPRFLPQRPHRARVTPGSFPRQPLTIVPTLKAPRKNRRRRNDANRCEVTQSHQHVKAERRRFARRRRLRARSLVTLREATSGKVVRKWFVDSTKAQEQIAMSAWASMLVRRQGLEPRTR
jgi:hypothetical protein